MHSKQLGRSLALAAGTVAAAELAARGYERRHQLQHQRRQDEGEGGSALLRVLKQRLAWPEPLPISLLLDEGKQQHRQPPSTAARSATAFFLGPRPPAGCKAAKEEYHAVPLPATDAAHTAEVVARFKGFISARDLETVCARVYACACA